MGDCYVFVRFVCDLLCEVVCLFSNCVCSVCGSLRDAVWCVLLCVLKCIFVWAWGLISLCVFFVGYCVMWYGVRLFVVLVCVCHEFACFACDV